MDEGPPAWAVERHREPAGDFHARAVPEGTARSVWVCEPTGPALVLGSAQPDGAADRAACERAGVEVVRRRSGGGAVLVRPDEPLWVDVVVSAGDPLWEADVGRAFLWLGDVWAGALRALGVACDVHRGGLQRTAWSPLVCFAGVGPGEVTLPSGAKVVGIAQRRTRHAARFQCAALARWDPEELLGILALEPAARRRAAGDLAGAAAPAGVDLGALLDAFLRHLPA